MTIHGRYANSLKIAEKSPNSKSESEISKLDN